MASLVKMRRDSAASKHQSTMIQTCKAIKKDCVVVCCISLYFVSHFSTFDPRLLSLHWYRQLTGQRAGGRRGYSPGSKGRVWYDILVLKLAVEVQHAGDECLRRSHTWSKVRGLLQRIRYWNRGVFVWSFKAFFFPHLSKSCSSFCFVALIFAICLKAVMDSVRMFWHICGLQRTLLHICFGLCARRFFYLMYS